MNKAAVRARIEEIGIVPSIRLASAEDAKFAAEVVADAGIPIVEVTMTIPGALDLIGELARAHADVAIGAGTVLDVATARRCIAAGAAFITSPGVNADVVEYAARCDVMVFPGVLTPTDVMAALAAGADLVKVFPCAPMGGASYLKHLSAPFPHVGLIAAGGVNQQTAAEFFIAGAVAVGIGTELIPRRAAQQRDHRWITELAHRFLAIVQAARGIGDQATRQHA
jgi:2-dehydro-3-deoxyphosphogluconate aldolase/(4S)-4-hydroxy-2-oxoglutarate aldolase